MAAYPYHITKELRRELRLSKTTLKEMLAVCDPPPPPDVLIKLLRGWRNLTPAQQAAWEHAAMIENLSTGAHPLQN